MKSRQPLPVWRADARAATRPRWDPVEPSTEITALTDLGKWITPSRLIRWIDQEIVTLNWDAPQVCRDSRIRLDYQAKRLLSLLCFAYATGVFVPEEITRKCYSDEVFRRICEGRIPSNQEMSNFRRRNRRLLQQILAGVFLRAVQCKFDLDAKGLSPELAQDVSDQVSRRLDVARHMDRGE
jgi:hypothetical protein